MTAWVIAESKHAGVRCRKSGGESVLASFPRSDYASDSTNIGWLARTGHIIRVALLDVSRVGFAESGVRYLSARGHRFPDRSAVIPLAAGLPAPLLVNSGLGSRLVTRGLALGDVYK